MEKLKYKNMTKIKSFNEFDKDSIIDNERESMERELLFRKKSRHDDTDISIDEVIEKITYELDNGMPHNISLGNRVEEIDGTRKSMLHIEYESPTIGRIRIFNPMNNARKGYFEHNGRMFKEDVSTIRDFYLKLCSVIK